MATKIYIKWTPRELLKRLEKKEIKVLFKQGAYLKKAMQRSMRYATKNKKVSQPGQPPLAHKDNPKGPLLRKLIAFFVDLSSKSVVTGPKMIGGGQPVPQVLDKGGTIRPKLLKKVDYKVGDFGPIRYRGGGKFARVKLQTTEQTKRAAELALEENAIRGSKAAIHIKPRPFTTPLLSDGGENFRKLVHSVPL